jgi:hypothetical protein
MSLQITVEQKNVTELSTDLLLLKHAQDFYGADAAVYLRLKEAGVCEDGEVSPELGEHVLIECEGAVAARRALFVGTPPLREFKYREMRQFARRAIEIIAAEQPDVRTVTTTTHGAGYGLDIGEALQSLIFGFQQGLAAHPLPRLEKIIFVEISARRAEMLRGLLADVKIVSPQAPDQVALTAKAQPAGPVVIKPPAEPARKKSVFVAMPFSEEFEDVYQFGIYGAVRKCGYVCEKVDESVFAGSIVERIMDGIKNAEFVIADLTMEKPNVYLEVGYAWGTQKPVLLIAREGHKLHFDLSHHKCIFYKTIGKLAESLDKTIREMFGTGEQT